MKNLRIFMMTFQTLGHPLETLMKVFWPCFRH